MFALKVPASSGVNGHQCLLACVLICSADHFAVLCRRPPPDKTKDKEGVSLNRTPLNQRSRGPPPPPPPPAEDSEEEGEEDGEEVTAMDVITMHAASCLSYCAHDGAGCASLREREKQDELVGLCFAAADTATF